MNLQYKNIDYCSGFFRLLFTVLLFCSLGACKKILSVESPDMNFNGENIFQNDETAIAALTGIFTVMSNDAITGPGITSLSLLNGLLADELQLNNNGSVDLTQFYKNDLTSRNIANQHWNTFYKLIYMANACIDGLSQSSSLTPAVRQQLTGEAKFVRAFCYFYLINIYGDVPLLTTTQYQVNGIANRNDQLDVWNQVISDLLEARSLLSDHYLDATLLSITNERVRPNTWAASALLARCYLYTGDFSSAQREAQRVIDAADLYQLNALPEAFIKNSTETVWALQPVGFGINTQDAQLFVLPENGPDAVHPVSLDTALMNQFEDGDLRRTSWIDSVVAEGHTYFFAAKYKIAQFNAPVDEYPVVLRLSEQYLISAEAHIQMGNFTAAADALNAVRNRAGLARTSAFTATELLSAVMRERRLEFFTEWGHRWFDLKRLDQLNIIMLDKTAMKGGQWDSHDQLLPIPFGDISTNPRLEQNPGYN